MEVEEALQKLGKVGKWQVAIFMITFLMLHPSMAWNMVSIVFLGSPCNAFVNRIEFYEFHLHNKLFVELGIELRN